MAAHPDPEQIPSEQAVLSFHIIATGKASPLLSVVFSDQMTASQPLCASP